MRTTLKTRSNLARPPMPQRIGRLAATGRHAVVSGARNTSSMLLQGPIMVRLGATLLSELFIAMFCRLQPACVTAVLAVVLLPTATAVAHELDNWFGIDWPPIYVQAGLEVNPLPGDHPFPVDSVTPGFGPAAPTWSNWIPNAPGPGPAPPPTLTDYGSGIGVQFRGATYHNVALHDDEVAPATTWAYDITVPEPTPIDGWGPGGWWWADETRVRGSVLHPIGGHFDHYMAVVGLPRGTVPGPSTEPRRVIIGGSIGRHTYPYPAIPNKEPIYGGAGLVPPSRLPSPDGDLPGGQLLTIIDAVADGVAPHFSLMAMLDGLQGDLISNVFMRKGQDGPILMDLRPMMQLQHLGPYSSALAIQDAVLPPSVVQAISAGNAYVSFEFPTSIHPDGRITGQLSVEVGAPAGVPGDYNNDNVVDAADYAVWRTNNGEILQLPNEVAGVTPGHVTQEDYDAWRARFGDTAGNTTFLTGNSAAADAHAPIPEPATVVLLLAAGTCTLSWPRRRRPA